MPLINTRCQVSEIVTRWTGTFDEPVTNAFVLQCALEGKLSLYAFSTGLRAVSLVLKKPIPMLGDPHLKIKVDAYLKPGYIKLLEHQIQALMNKEPTTIIFVDLMESKFMQTGEPINLDGMKHAILGEKDRIEITPDAVSFLTCLTEQISAFEQEFLLKDKEALEKPIKDSLKYNAGKNEGNHELNFWLIETWEKEGMPGGTSFFRKLKKYENQKGSPITQHYSAGTDAGIDYTTNYGTKGSMKRKTILNIVSQSKKSK